MAESIVKVPSTASSDMDFLAFSFNGKHSWDDFGIYRISDGDRYNENLSPIMTDKTAENSGGDGMYFFGTNHKQKDFNITFAFDHLTDSQVQEMKRWLNGKEMGDLWFEEAPYKVWTAKVTGQPNIKYIPFDDYDENGNKIRIYKGEGLVTFIAYWPYAHTPDYVIVETTSLTVKVGEWTEVNSVEKIIPYVMLPVSGEYLTFIRQFQINNEETIYSYSGGILTTTRLNATDGIKTIKILPQEDYLEGQSITFSVFSYNTYSAVGVTYSRINFRPFLENGRQASSYSNFSNKSLWLISSGLTDTSPCRGENPGDLPAPFIMRAPKTITAETSAELTFEVGELEITIPAKTATKQEYGSFRYTHYNSIEWDSKTGMVSAEVNGKRIAIPYTGNSLGGIPVGGIPSTDISINGGTLEYHYWYY